VIVARAVDARAAICTAEVADAVAEGRPVVALESTLLAHGLPRPANRAAAAQVEAAVRAAGAVPATIAVLDGVPRIGLDDDGLDRVCTDALVKLSVRDLPIAVGLGLDGATTVAATALLAHRAGVGVFATGGLGGVHRGGAESFDVSADLETLAAVPIVLVCAGVKSILDVAATLERLETLSVLVLGFGTDRFPGFYLRDSGYAVPWRVDQPGEVAAIARARTALGLPQAVVVANPVPESAQLDRATHDRVLTEALDAAALAGVRGRDVTPFLLEWFHTHTDGESLTVNIALVCANAALAGQIAVESAA
jgi:pseudouridine-5'-phosphate glycosidase